MNAILIELAVFLGGLAICLWHRGVSRWMWLLVASMAGMVGFSLFKLYDFLTSPGYCFPGLWLGWYAGCLVLFFTGLSKVLSGIVRERRARLIDRWSREFETKHDLRQPESITTEESMDHIREE
jgi:hypothetical protein